MKKVLLTATVQSHIAQFHKPLVEILHEAGYEVHVAAKNNLAEKNGLNLEFVDQVFDIPFARSPKSSDNIKAYKALKRIIKENDYEVIHCNTPMGGIVTRLAALGSKARVIYTAHGFHFYQGASKKNWLVFYPIEKFFSRFTDTLITITHEDYELASAKFHCHIEHMHGVGVYSQRYHPVDETTKHEMRVKENLSNRDFVILCTGELNKNKNQTTLINAVGKLVKDIPNIKVLLAGNGPLEEELKTQVKELNIENNIKFLGYRTDLETITPSVDLVVSCSFREGLPLNILEAMLCKKAVVTSINRGHKELVEDGITGYKVLPTDVDSYIKHILDLYKNPDLRDQLGVNGYNMAQDYTTESIKKELKKIYFK